ncbi:alpha/beta hydrolase [Neisseria zalophi]|uniref:Alpha/beta fold hydrolase n=1 Tax=Neisseria zalophi TaxID=640030 RepID=A0A5J6PU17_9NEIS|nr:alpha/beta hydrolase [Neisseria zalophi]QEY26218.1 alpha/beta fold hydrolase [Neisseria zalophi]
MLKPVDKITIPGPVGGLETIYLPAQGEERGVAVINHPNPLHGGTNTNKVIQTVAKALNTLGFHCYLPNLRGVGNSDGEHDHGQGETEDCISVIDYVRAQHPKASQLIISGFSFGGYVSLFAAQQRNPDLLLLMAPAVKYYDRITEPKAPDTNKTLLIHGQIDEVVPLENAFKWAEPQELPVIVIPEASHFFHGKLIALRDTVLRFVPSVLNT